MALIPGTRLGLYEIVAAIGAGGMGEVYRARDTRLDRDVAIKVLPDAYAADTERIVRFQREAKTLAALNHPNIAQIYGLEQEGDVHALAMELIAGEDLSQRLARGAIPLDEALAMAKQIAEALEAAHEQGIIHRDLKPANIKVREDSTVKVLDFGLAKAMEPVDGEPNLSQTPTVMSPAMMTGIGVILGTAAYMSPEQARGKRVDRRTDIWAFGCVLYEMLAGRPAFKGEGVSETMAEVLKSEPNWTTLPALHPRVRELLDRCLQKDATQRWQSIGDVRIELERIIRGAPEVAAIASIPTHQRVSGQLTASRGMPWLILAGLGLVAVVAVFVTRMPTGEREQVGASTPLNTSFATLTTEAGTERFPSLSPDGRWMVYASDREGNLDIYLRAVGAATPINLTKDSKTDDDQPAFSADGERVAFRSERDGGGIFVMGRTGESPRKVTPRGFHPSWSPAGDYLAYCTEQTLISPEFRGQTVSQLWVVHVTTGEQRQLPVHDGLQPAWSPRGTHIAFWGYPVESRNREIWTVPLAGGEPTRVTDHPAVDWNPVWYPDGKYLFFGSNRGGSLNLWRMGIDESSGKPLSEAEPVTTPAALAAHFSFSNDGKRMLLAAYHPGSHVHAVSFDSSTGTAVDAPRVLTSGSRTWGALSVSPDGKQLVLASRYPQEDLFIADAEFRQVSQITDDPATDRLPGWSPVGDEILVQSSRSGDQQHIYSLGPNGSGMKVVSPAILAGRPVSWLAPRWSPDGKRFVATAFSGSSHIFSIGTSASSSVPDEIPPFGESKARLNAIGWTPDGRYIVGNIRSQRGPLLLYDTRSGAYRTVSISFDPPFLSWIDGQRFLTVADGQIVSVNVETAEVRPAVPRSSRSQPQSVPVLAPDRRRLYFIVDSTESDISLMTIK